MSEGITMDVLNWIPQLKSNNISIDSTNRIKPRLLTAVKFKCISTKENNSKRMVVHFRVLERNSLSIVNRDMNDKGIRETNLPFWYNANDNDFLFKVTSIGYEENVEYNIDAEFRGYRTKTNNGYTCILHNRMNTSNNNTNWIELE